MATLQSAPFHFLLLFQLIFFGLRIPRVTAIEDEEFTEELLLKPLPDRKTIAHFHFQTRSPRTDSYGKHHRLFPKSIYQLVHKYRIREMELSFTQGRWNYERWGGFHPLSSSNAKPPGVELWAVFDSSLVEIDANWRNLTHALSGLFCASINFLDSTTTYSAPDWGFRSYSGYLRYGALPREAVCTENLTPWLKLLPCRDKAGLAALMDRPSIYRGYYHSQRLRLTSTDFGHLKEGALSGMVLEQTLTVVLQPSKGRFNSAHSSGGSTLSPDWSLSSLFGRKITGKCVLAKSSSVFLELERGLASEIDKLGKENESFQLSIPPDEVMRENYNSTHSTSSTLFEFSVERYNEHNPLDVGMIWKVPLTWSCLQAPFQVSRFLTGSGNERGSIAVSLSSMSSHEVLIDSHNLSLLTNGNSCSMRVVIFQMVPWYVKVYYHRLQIFIDGQAVSTSEVVENIRVLPSLDKVSPGMMEMVLKLPCGTKSAALTLDFDKAFLHIDEYPPDANQGFDIPSAVISFPDFVATINYSRENSSKISPMLSTFQERNIVQAYTEVLLVPLTTPDFSMPYNVITFTCTVLALYFGSLINVLRRRIGEEERKTADTRQGLIPRLLKRLKGQKSANGEPQSPQSSSVFSPKLFIKVSLVAVIAICWHYLNRE